MNSVILRGLLFIFPKSPLLINFFVQGLHLCLAVVLLRALQMLLLGRLEHHWRGFLAQLVDQQRRKLSFLVRFAINFDKAISRLPLHDMPWLEEQDRVVSLADVAIVVSKL